MRPFKTLTRHSKLPVTIRLSHASNPCLGGVGADSRSLPPRPSGRSQACERRGDPEWEAHPRLPSLAVILTPSRCHLQPPARRQPRRRRLARLSEPSRPVRGAGPPRLRAPFLVPCLVLQGPPHRHLRVPRCLPRVPGRSVPPATVARSAALRPRLALQVRTWPRGLQVAFSFFPQTNPTGLAFAGGLCTPSLSREAMCPESGPGPCRGS